MTSSLSARLLGAVSLLLLLFFGLTIFVLELAYRDSVESATEDRLDVQLIVLLAAAEPDEMGLLYVPGQLPEARFETPGSGLFGQVTAPDETLIWRSPSSVGTYVPVGDDLSPGVRRFGQATASDGTDVFTLSLGVQWELDDGSARDYTFTVSESIAPYLAQVARFRRQLLTWFGALMLAMLTAQAILMRKVLSPLRRVEKEIGEIESGQRTELGGGYPRELHGVALNTNRLIRTERNRLARYRNTLGNLAHSLKTPLAVMRAILENASAANPSDAELHSQIDRMNDIVGYQLHRAAASGGAALGHDPVPAGEVLQTIVDTLRKVHSGKSPDFQLTVPGDIAFFGDRGDWMEMTGNLLDNACKWCVGTVRVTLSAVGQAGLPRPGLRLVVEDDGPGIDAEDARRVLQRGVRADQRVAGHGIGLSVVREIADMYDGKLTIAASDLGGARIEITVPPS